MDLIFAPAGVDIGGDNNGASTTTTTTTSTTSTSPAAVAVAVEEGEEGKAKAVAVNTASQVYGVSVRCVPWCKRAGWIDGWTEDPLRRAGCLRCHRTNSPTSIH